jgi:hypothetical protein
MSNFISISNAARRSMRSSRGVALAASLIGGTLSAQDAPRVLTGRLSGGISGQGSDPQGDFGKNTGAGWGGGGSLVLRLDPASIINLRLDASFLTYGNQNRRIPLSGTGGLIQLDLRTSNNIGTVVTGLQLLGPTGPVTPYAAVLGGFSVFWTESTVEGSQDVNTPFASTTNANDAALAYGGMAGLYIRVANGARPVRIDLGARVLRHDNAQYLTDERIREAFENDRAPVSLRGRADFVTYYAGVNVILW